MAARKKKKLPLLEEIEIIDAGSEGKAVARKDNMVVFVPFAAPGDICDVQVTRKRKSYYEGRVLAYHKKSEIRTTPQCQHFGLCGGCKWQHIQYQKQLEFKQKQVTDNFTRIGKLEIPEIQPIIGSEEQYHYRNKLEFTFSNRKWLIDNNVDRNDEDKMKGLGFHLPGMFDRILDIEECLLQDDLSNKIRNAIRDYTIKQGYSYYDVYSWEGIMRNIIFRNTTLNEWMVIVVFNEDNQPLILELLYFIKETFPEITSLMYVINKKRNPDISDLEIRWFAGQEFILEEMEDLKFKIGPKSFFQTNSQQALKLYRVSKEFADFKGHENVYDLYTGTGTIANFIARNVSKVTGIEYVADAIEDAKENSRLNDIQNTSFYAGDIIDELNDDFVKKHGKPDVIITDPPRAGMHEKVIKKMMELAPDKIVYISCNSATQARDIALMTDKYTLRKIQTVDMFPQTQHVENVALLVFN
ncbi:MAG: 23S rRNA (uracil(1939)-C(5))-methyltransferase RlmD [Bacteroidota bacterium]|nr:23S rRNA (uracil(1939)-C(5))-methyltransferase RlmD [Bacteroidota bacterium]